jgi:hypothetical protein
MKFANAFKIALDAYVGSIIRVNVNKAIRVLLEGEDRLDDSALSDIIMNHRLRTWLFFECHQLTS